MATTNGWNGRNGRLVLAGLCAGALLMAAGGVASAQTLTDSSTVASSGDARRDTLMKLTRPITVNVTDNRLEDVINFIKDFSGAALDPEWIDDANPEGLDKDKLITVNATNISVLTLLERVLALASDGDISQNSWQLAPTGECQLGPKARLNKHKRVEIYDINDLLMDIPDYAEVPLIDLQSVLQSGQGGGGGRSPFRNDDNQQQNDRTAIRDEKSNEIIDIITELVEPDQWLTTGGTGGSIRVWQGAIIVNAPDYMHRQLNGYQFWPRRLTNFGSAGGRRYVSLGTDTGLSTIDGIANQEVSAVVGGQIIRSGPGGGR
ncbi:MAG: hypothetical protein ACKVU4_07235 [Phycisphaerales bacterium]